MAYYNLGVVLRKLGRFEEAEKHFRRAIALDLSHTEALHELAKIRLEQQHYDEALELLQYLTDIDPDHAGVLGDIGIALFYLGRSDEAPATLRPSTFSRPDLRKCAYQPRGRAEGDGSYSRLKDGPFLGRLSAFSYFADCELSSTPSLI